MPYFVFTTGTVNYWFLFVCCLFTQGLNKASTYLNVSYYPKSRITMILVLKELWWFYCTESESEVSQLCPALCDPMDCSLPGFSVHGIFQARILEWVAISFSRGSSWPRDWTQVSHIVSRCFTGKPHWIVINHTYIRRTVCQEKFFHDSYNNPLLNRVYWNLVTYVGNYFCLHKNNESLLDDSLHLG